MKRVKSGIASVRARTPDCATLHPGYACFVGEFLESGLDERLAWHAPHRIQHSTIPNAAAGHLRLYHALASTSQIQPSGQLDGSSAATRSMN